jgi:hypothetical protein
VIGSNASPDRAAQSWRRLQGSPSGFATRICPGDVRSRRDRLRDRRLSGRTKPEIKNYAIVHRICATRGGSRYHQLRLLKEVLHFQACALRRDLARGLISKLRKQEKLRAAKALFEPP